MSVKVNTCFNMTISPSVMRNPQNALNIHIMFFIALAKYQSSRMTRIAVTDFTRKTMSPFIENACRRRGGGGVLFCPLLLPYCHCSSSLREIERGACPCPSPLPPLATTRAHSITPLPTCEMETTDNVENLLLALFEDDWTKERSFFKIEENPTDKTLVEIYVAILEGRVLEPSTLWSEYFGRVVDDDDAVVIRNRVDDDEILRVPSNPNERACRNGANCQGYIAFGDVLTEVPAAGPRREQPGFCLRCIRYNSTFIIVNLLAHNKNIAHHAMPKIFNKVGVRGEYAIEQSLISSPQIYHGNLLAVIPEYKNYYTRAVDPKTGVVYHRQTKYLYPDKPIPDSGSGINEDGGGGGGDGGGDDGEDDSKGSDRPLKKVMLSMRASMPSEGRHESSVQGYFASLQSWLPSHTLPTDAYFYKGRTHPYIWNPRYTHDPPATEEEIEYILAINTIDYIESLAAKCDTRRIENILRSWQDRCIVSVLKTKPVLPPDLSPHVLNSSVFGKGSKMRSLYSDQDIFLSKLILTSFTPTNDLSSIANQLGEMSKKDTIVFDALLSITMNGYLGRSDHCKVSATFHRRHDIHIWQSVYFGNVASFLNWIEVHPATFLFLFREYVFDTMYTISAIGDYICCVNRWSLLQKNVSDVCDQIRTICDAELDGRRDSFHELKAARDIRAEKVALTYNKQFNKLLDKFTSNSVVETIVSVMNKVNLKKIVKGPRLDCKDELIEVVHSFVDTMHDIMPIDANRAGTLKYLVGAESIQPFVDTVKQINIFDLSNTVDKLTQTLTALIEANQKDFYLLRAFYENLQAKECMMVYPTPTFITKKQRASYSKLYGHLDPLPRWAGNYYFCRNCGTVKTQIFRGERHLALSQNNAVYDVSTNRVFCSTAFSRNNIPDYSNSKDPERKIILKVDRDRRKNALHSRCVYEPLQMINFIGKIVTTKNQGLVAACPECAVLTSISKESLDCRAEAFSCGCSG